MNKLKLSLTIDLDTGAIEVQGLEKPVGFDMDPNELTQFINGLTALGQYPGSRNTAFEFWSGAEFDAISDEGHDEVFNIGGWGVQCFDDEQYTFKLG